MTKLQIFGSQDPCLRLLVTGFLRNGFQFIFLSWYLQLSLYTDTRTFSQMSYVICTMEKTLNA